jgi:hypothetical protein
MQRKKAVALQQAWGKKPCSHPTLVREYEDGVRTGDYFCAQCGAAITFQQKVELQKSRS